MLFLATALFFLLSPGMLLTLPPISKVLASEETSNLAVFVHTVVFYFILRLTHDGTFPFGYFAEAETYLTGENF